MEFRQQSCAAHLSGVEAEETKILTLTELEGQIAEGRPLRSKQTRAVPT